MSTHRFPELMKRVFASGRQDAHGKVRVVFVVELDAKSTNTDATWIATSSGYSGFGRSGEQAFADLVEGMEARNGR